eukprot:SAG22_NODE_922_length_6485_cov_1.825556_2_plen_871_part_00
MSRDDMLVAELEAEAMSAAERAVRTWLPMMFGAEELQELCTAYGVTPAAPGEDYEALFARLMEPFAEAHLSQLSRPPGGLVPLLLDGEAEGGKDARRGWSGKLDMYWRGALSLHKMKVPMLQSLLQKRPYLHEYLAEAVQDDDVAEHSEHDIDAEGARPPTEEEMAAVTDPQEELGEQAPPAQEQSPQTEGDSVVEPRLKLRMIQALLPEYTMVAETPEYHAKRKQEVEERKKKLAAAAAGEDSSECTDRSPPGAPAAADEGNDEDDDETVEEVLSRAKLASESTASTKQQVDQHAKPAVAADAFSPASCFSGAREGWFFTTGAHGLGYYRDTSKPAPEATKVAKVMPPARKAAAAASGAADKKEDDTSAARHTYDRGYKKWENFDADAAAADTDSEEDDNAATARRTQAAKRSELEPEPEPELQPEPAGETAVNEDDEPLLESSEEDEPLFETVDASSSSPPQLPQPPEWKEDKVASKAKAKAKGVNAPSAHGGSSGPSPSTAEEWKAAGTEALKAGRFDDAATAYHRALACMPPPPPRGTDADEEEEGAGASGGGGSLAEDPLGGSGGGTQLSEEQLAAYERKVAEVEAEEAEKAKAKRALNEVEAMRLALHNNLALVSLKQEDWSGTVRAADVALELEPASAKALYRRGVANFELQLQMRSDASPAAVLNDRSSHQASETTGKAVEKALALAQTAWTDLVKAQALLPTDKGLGRKVKEVEGWLREQRAQARALREAQELEARKAAAAGAGAGGGAGESRGGSSKSKYSADYGRFDDFDPATDSDDEENLATVERERVSRLAKLDELKGMIERSGDDQGSLDKAFDWVSKAAKENEGRRIVLNLTTSDRSRSASFGIGTKKTHLFCAI